MAGAPWLGASGRDGNALRQTLQLLKDIGDMEIPFHAVAEAAAHAFGHNHECRVLSAHIYYLTIQSKASSGKDSGCLVKLLLG